MKWTMLNNGQLYVEDIMPSDVVKRNFSGNNGKYKGKRTIAIRIPEDLAEYLTAEGWKLWERKMNDAGELIPAVLEAQMKYWEEGDSRNPEIAKITSKQQRILDEDELADLDWAEYDMMDIIYRVNPWKMDDGRTGLTTYVKSMAFVMHDDPIKSKFSNIPFVTGGDGE